MSREKHENVLTARDVAEAQLKAAREQLNQAVASSGCASGQGTPGGGGH